MIQPERIRVEYLKGSGKYPTVIDIQRPQITWNVAGTAVQQAYQILAIGNKGTYFDSGKIESREMKCILDADFHSGEIIQAEVKLWGNEEVTVEPCNFSFEMGLLNKSDWKAKWINPEKEIPDSENERPASYVKKKFVLEKLPQNARLYATAHGIYQVFINGKEVEGFVLAPGTSEYVKRLQYQVYDVTPFLKEGENVIIATIGNGWWRGTVTYDGVKNGFGSDVAFLAQLEADGQCVCITDESWLASQSGPVRECDLMQGEIYDALREEIFQENSAEGIGQSESSWHPVKLADFGYANLVCSNCPPVLEHERFTPQLIISPKGEQILDFGQNIAGYMEFAMECKGDEVWKFTHGETLDKDGNFCNSNFQSTKFYCAQEIIYKAKEGKNHFKAFGTFMGFRYVKVELQNLKIPYFINPDNFHGIAVYSDLEILTDFECGNHMVNQLYQNALWSIKGNLIDIPTDCPTREKSGFTGDLVTFIHTFQYLMDAYPMVRKFVVNQAASQGENGCVKQIVADCRPMAEIDGSAGWSDSFEILPWRLGQHCNDYRVFDENYKSIQNWLGFCIGRAASETRPENEKNPWKEYLYDTGLHWGEWAEPEINSMEELMYAKRHGSPEVATAYMAYGCEIMAEEAKRIGDAKAAYYKDVSENAKKAYEAAFLVNDIPMAAGYEKWSASGGSISWDDITDIDGAVLHDPEHVPEKMEASERMCRYVRPIALNLVEEKAKYKLAGQLEQLVKKHEYCLNTGFLTTHELCRTLSDYGFAETAYKVLLNEKCPGWLYPVKCGATTVTESWEAYGQDGSRNASFNHYSYGSVVGWLIDTAAGIRLKDGKITIAPKTSKLMEHIKCTYQSPFGKIESSWKYENNQVHCQFQIPGNCNAEICLENGERYIVGPGSYKYTYSN